MSDDADSTAGLVVRPAYPMIGSRFDALHASLNEVNDHLAGAGEPDAEALEDLVGELLNFGNGGAQGLASRGIVFIERAGNQ